MGSDEETTAKQNSQLTTIKVKQEKIDPEIEEKIIESSKNKSTLNNNAKGEEIFTNVDNSDTESSVTTDDDNDELEDKKCIEPVKSSNEILAELFKVFNAAPPDELLDDKSLLKKKHKQKKQKKDKEKRKKVKKEKNSKFEGEVSDSDILDALEDVHTKNKKKKHKRKTDKEKDRDKDKERGKSREKHKKREKDREKDKSTERDKESGKSKEKALRNKSKESELERVRFIKQERYQDNERMYKRESKKFSETTLSAIKEEPYSHNFRNGKEHRKRNIDDFDKYAEPNKRSRSNTSSQYIARIKIREINGHISDISLSDEETFLKEREQHHANGGERSRYDYERNYRSGTRPERQEHYDNYRGNNRRHRNSPPHSHSRSRTRSRSRSLGIDKKRLLEIARKNAISMFKRGNLPGCADMSQEVKDKVLLKMRYGGRTVQDLTDFCKKISNGEELSDLSSDEDSDVDKHGNAKAFHHPFQVKEHEPIVMHIRNATPILPRKITEEQTKAITMQFPVSSGQQHRLTEGWVPVETKDSLAPMPSLPSAKQSTNVFKTTKQRNIFAKTMPNSEQQQPAFTAVGGSTSETTNNGEDNNYVSDTVDTNEPTANVGMPSMPPMSPVPPIPLSKPIPQPPAVPPAFMPVNNSVPTTTVPTANYTLPPLYKPPPVFNKVPHDQHQHQHSVPNAPPVCPPVTPFDVGNGNNSNNSVFPQASDTQLDVSAIISKRLNAMRRLQENPLDSEAIQMIYKSQKDMSSWVSSKFLPGQFTGSTGANVLKAHELNSGPQIWARRDQLTSAKPMTGGMGMHLLQKMGWKPGEGLGREKTGTLQPLLLDVKLDKRGLVAREDNNGLRRGPKQKQRATSIPQVQQSLKDKHPVCLLNELTSKRKWTPPLYTLVNEVGPSHNRSFMFSVSLNGNTFTPNLTSNTKKEAKSLAAKFCLEQLGILPTS